MATVTPTPADLLPTPPTTADPSSFDARADATLLAQQAMVPQLNKLAADTYTNAVDAKASADSALASKNAATATAQSISDNAASAAQSAAAAASATAVSAANTATQQATSAAASAAAAQQASAAVQWVSGTTYTKGNVVWSPIDLQIYRRSVAGAGTTDPSIDTANWVQLTGIKYPVLGISTATTAVACRAYAFMASTSLTLPASPSNGDWVDFANLSGTTTCTVLGNGKNVVFSDQTLVIDNVNYFGRLVFMAAADKWIFY